MRRLCAKNNRICAYFFGPSPSSTFSAVVGGREKADLTEDLLYHLLDKKAGISKDVSLNPHFSSLKYGRVYYSKTAFR